MINIKLDFKEVIALGIIAPILAGIFLFHYEDWFGEKEKLSKIEVKIEPQKPEIIAKDIKTQIKNLQNPNAPLEVTLWINEPNAKLTSEKT